MAIVSAEKICPSSQTMVMQLVDLMATTFEWTQVILRSIRKFSTYPNPMGAKQHSGYKVCKALIENLVESMGGTPSCYSPWTMVTTTMLLNVSKLVIPSIMFDGSTTFQLKKT